MSVPPSPDILDRFARTTEETFSTLEFQRLLASGRQLRIKYGVDVTAPNLHIGHAVNLWMMRWLQDLGHKVVFLIGDATTRIGDPTGKNMLRPVIPPAEIEANAQAFLAQAGMVLRCDNPALYEVRRNSEWYERMSAGELTQLLSMVTYARLASRDMFKERMQQGHDIHMHELIYPILQGYDSVALESDLTVIGSDQLFNEMMGRFFQERLGQPPQVIITTKITPGIDGKAKQSKSLGNYIGLSHSPRDKFGRVMTLPDHLIVEYLEVYTGVPLQRVAEIATQVRDEPMKWKLFLAHEIVGRYHGAEIADREQEWFLQTFSARETPEDVSEIQVEPGEQLAFDLVLQFFGPQRSRGQVRRLFKQGAVSLNGLALSQIDQLVEVHHGDVFRVGKRTWFRLRVES
ncbi:MAG: tyrosine--tRNA ligase [Chloroflexi bacterium]|nr:MAG: tyrosine--tRNA ligase [Chloroflexota bacterium]